MATKKNIAPKITKQTKIEDDEDEPELAPKPKLTRKVPVTEAKPKAEAPVAKKEAATTPVKKEAAPAKKEAAPAKKEAAAPAKKEVAAPAKKEVAAPAKKAETETNGKKAESAKKPQESPEELYSQFVENWVNLRDGAESHHHFLRIGKPKNPLQIGGMKQQLNDPEMAYSIDMLLAGKFKEFDRFLGEDSVQKWLESREITEDDVRENLITVKNFDKRKGDADFLDLQRSKKETLAALQAKVDEIKSYLEKSKSTPKSKKETLLERLGEYAKAGKVYDVSGWDKDTHTGFKTVATPTPRSQKKRITTYPICANGVEKIRLFLEYLDLDPALADEAK